MNVPHFLIYSYSDGGLVCFHFMAFLTSVAMRLHGPELECPVKSSAGQFSWYETVRS